MKLKQLGSNQTEVELSDGVTVLFSYQTPVALHVYWVLKEKKITCTGEGLAAPVACGFYRTSHKWSRTTSKHINKWLAGAVAVEKEQSFFDNLVTNALL